jgi:hypothetical protein
MLVQSISAYLMMKFIAMYGFKMDALSVLPLISLDFKYALLVISFEDVQIIPDRRL